MSRQPIRDGAALEDFLGEEVVDAHGEPVGTLACYWEMEERKALLLGVDVPQRSGVTHLVPAKGAVLNERQAYVQVSFAAERVVQAPCLDCGRELDDAFEEQVWAYYGLPVPATVEGLIGAKQKQLRRQLRRMARSEGGEVCNAPAPSEPSSASTAAGLGEPPKEG